MRVIHVNGCDFECTEPRSAQFSSATDPGGRHGRCGPSPLLSTDARCTLVHHSFIVFAGLLPFRSNVFSAWSLDDAGVTDGHAASGPGSCLTSFALRQRWRLTKTRGRLEIAGTAEPLKKGWIVPLPHNRSIITYKNEEEDSCFTGCLWRECEEQQET